MAEYKGVGCGYKSYCPVGVLSEEDADGHGDGFRYSSGTGRV